VESDLVEKPAPVIVELPGQDQTEGSQQPQQQKKGPGRPPKSGTSNDKKKTANAAAYKNDVSQLIQGVFGLISLKAGAHWNVSQAEADQISSPLCNILAKMNVLEKVATVSDGAALVVAAVSIVVPRVVITAAQVKDKKAKKEDVKNAGNQQSNEPKSKGFTVISGKAAGGAPETKFDAGQSIKAVCDELISGA
jgi:hypothetical protein